MQNDRAATLAERLRKRDPAALAGVYDLYGQLVYSVFLRIVADRNVAEDLVQELFLRVWNRTRGLSPPEGSLGIWILLTARNTAINYVRSAQASFPIGIRPVESSDQLRLLYKSMEPEFVLDNVKAVQEAFSTLDSNQKKVLELAYFDGLLQSEIAARLTEPADTVKSWLGSALGKLRSTLKTSVPQ